MRIWSNFIELTQRGRWMWHVSRKQTAATIHSPENVLPPPLAHERVTLPLNSQLLIDRATRIQPTEVIWINILKTFFVLNKHVSRRRSHCSIVARINCHGVCQLHYGSAAEPSLLPINYTYSTFKRSLGDLWQIFSDFRSPLMRKQCTVVPPACQLIDWQCVAFVLWQRYGRKSGQRSLSCLTQVAKPHT